MRKLGLFFAVLFAVLTVGVHAQGAMSQNLKVYVNSDSNVVTAALFLSEGNAIVGHFGIKYNTEKLELVRHDLGLIPDEIPVRDADGNDYLAKIVKAASSDVVITPDSNKPAELVLKDKGQVMFGWYSTKNAVISPSTNSGAIALLYFNIKTGIKAEDISSSDFSFIKNEDCADIPGWSSGIISIASDEKAYLAETDNRDQRLNLSIALGLNEKIPEVQEDDDLPDIKTEPEEDNEDKEETTTEDTSLYESAKISASISGAGAGMRLLIDDGLKDVNVPEYRVIIKDTNGNEVRNISGIVGITRSLTIKDLAPDFELVAEISAYTKDGKLLDSTSVSYKTPSTPASTAKVYSVKYDVKDGTMYGFNAEDVIFGNVPTKVPTVYAPDGYKFAGWSVDGTNTVDIEKYNIYKDTVFTAVYEKE